jgi:hypothetical protein
VELGNFVQYIQDYGQKERERQSLDSIIDMMCDGKCSFLRVVIVALVIAIVLASELLL